MSKYLAYCLVAVALWLTACNSTENNNGKNNIYQSKKSPIALKTKDQRQVYTLGDSILLKLELTDGKPVDKFQLWQNDSLLLQSDSFPTQYLWHSQGRVGVHRLKAVIFRDTTQELQYLRLTLTSDQIPQQYTYKVRATYPHDSKAYTQGLIYHEGLLYEGTGQPGESSLRKVEIKTGKVLQQHNLESKLFGEGITIFNDQIIQLTYTARRGFVYDLESFTPMHEFFYPTEGWGLTSIGRQLLMSDGSEHLYYLDPVSFIEVDRLQVYDHKGKVEMLNELEYIEGEVYANIYQTDRIARIDPKTGKVLAYIDLTGILPAADRHHRIDVLNGIAYDAENKRLFVTGKYWPKLFEIELINQKQLSK